MSEQRTPFVLGKPIKTPEDFYGRERELRELFESVKNMQPAALVGEHRCGNTSILYQMVHPDQQAKHLNDADRERLLFVFVNAQLAGDAPESLFRRTALALRRSDDETTIDFNAPTDRAWIENYLEDLAFRGKRLVLLIDEFDVLAGYEGSFWEWFRGLIIEYDVSPIVASRLELGRFREDWGSGSPFFNMFRTVYMGSFTADEADRFVAEISALADFDFRRVRHVIDRLAGRFPFYMQVAMALLYVHVGDASTITDEAVADVEQEFRARNEHLFADAWPKLPEVERDALCQVAVGAGADARVQTLLAKALPSLERRGYILDGHIFSTAFADFVRRQMMRIELNAETGEVRIEKRTIELPPKEFALLRFLMDSEGDVVTKDDIAAAVWPEYSGNSLGVTDAMIQKTISRLRKEIEVDEGEEGSFQHIESIRGQGYRFQNASVQDVYLQRESMAPA